jgi:hypothetical protein
MTEQRFTAGDQGKAIEDAQRHQGKPVDGGQTGPFR